MSERACPKCKRNPHFVVRDPYDGARVYIHTIEIDENTGEPEIRDYCRVPVVSIVSEKVL